MKKKDLIQGFFSNWNKKRNEQAKEEEQKQVCNTLLNNVTINIEKAHHRNLIKIQGDGSLN